MHQIRIGKFTEPDKKSHLVQNHLWTVLLPMAWIFFSSKRNMLAWFAELNRHLNQLAHDLNMLQADIYQEYRYYYFHLERSDRQHIENELKALHGQFQYLLNPFDSLSGNYVVYMRFSNIMQSMQRIAEILTNNDMNKLATVQRYRMQSIHRKLEYLEQQMYHFPTSGPCRIDLREN